VWRAITVVQPVTLWRGIEDFMSAGVFTISLDEEFNRTDTPAAMEFVDTMMADLRKHLDKEQVHYAIKRTSFELLNKPKPWAFEISRKFMCSHICCSPLIMCSHASTGERVQTCEDCALRAELLDEFVAGRPAMATLNRTEATEYILARDDIPMVIIEVAKNIFAYALATSINFACITARAPQPYYTIQDEKPLGIATSFADIEKL
jgi:hypothetical protein